MVSYLRLSVFIVYLCMLIIDLLSATEILGLSPKRLSLYTQGKSFQCDDGSLIMPHDRINDDYCDCNDGTDEPGTSACPNGSFYCSNQGYRANNIPSSHVNDGICDCCDGSDEYNGLTQCQNSCIDLGRQLREEEARQRELVTQGHEIYKDYSRQGTNAIVEKRDHLAQLEEERERLEAEKKELDKAKKDLEQPETEAKESFKASWEAEKERRREERKKLAAGEAFVALDLDQDGLVSIAELQTHREFDIDANGEVSVDEAMEYLDEQSTVDVETFTGRIWENIHQIYSSSSASDTTASQDPEGVEQGGEESDDTRGEELSPEDEDEERHRSEGDDEEDEDEEGEGRDDERVKEKPTESKSSTDEQEEPMPDYDEETQQLIAAAEEARKQFNDVDEKVRSAQSNIDEINKLLDSDLGAQNEYYPLRDQCFDFTDREYTYSLCPFNKAVQRNKGGGGETSLGRWGSWSGDVNSKYSMMTYDHGQNCWNGPDRSAKVHIECGLANELVSVSEPNRCEYRFVFNTPAACNNLIPVPAHDEL